MNLLRRARYYLLLYKITSYDEYIKEDLLDFRTDIRRWGSWRDGFKIMIKSSEWRGHRIRGVHFNYVEKGGSVVEIPFLKWGNEWEWNPLAP